MLTVLKTSDGSQVAAIGDFADVFELMFGPQQHDSHVKLRASHLKHAAWKAEYAANLARAEAEIAAAGGVLAWLRTPNTTAATSYPEAAE